MVIIRPIMKRKIKTTMNAAELQKLATIPQIIKIHRIETIRNKLQLSIMDCLVDFFLWKVLNSVCTNMKKNNASPNTERII
jgi:hypothetical protein